MTAYVDKISMDFNTEHYPPHCDRQCLRCKEWKNFMCFRRSYYCKTGRYLMQYKTTVNV